MIMESRSGSVVPEAVDPYLPRIAHWPWLFALSSLAALALALSVKGFPDFSAHEYQFNLALDQFRTPALSALALSLDWVFSPLQGTILVAAITVTTALFSKIRAFQFLYVVFLGYAVGESLKMLVQRSRPDLQLLNEAMIPLPHSFSFPSGHSGIGIALAYGLWVLCRNTKAQRWGIALGLIVALALGWSRLYLGVHYPSDVIGAWLITTSVVLLAFAAWNAWIAPALTKKSHSDD